MPGQAPFHTDVFLTSVKRGRTLPIDWRYQEWLQQFEVMGGIVMRF